MIVYGDGSFGLNGFEFDTAVRFGLPIIGIVGNDAAWGQMMRPQAMIYGGDRLVATVLSRTRYDKVVEALGGHGEHVTEPDEIGPADRAPASFAAGRPGARQRRDPAGQQGVKGSTYVWPGRRRPRWPRRRACESGVAGDHGALDGEPDARLDAINAHEIERARVLRTPLAAADLAPARPPDDWTSSRGQTRDPDRRCDRVW